MQVFLEIYWEGCYFKLKKRGDKKTKGSLLEKLLQWKHCPKFLRYKINYSFARERYHPCDCCSYGHFTKENVEDALGYDPCEECGDIELYNKEHDITI